MSWQVDQFNRGLQATTVRVAVLLHPVDYGRQSSGHFNPLHDSHAQGFWPDTLI